MPQVWRPRPFTLTAYLRTLGGGNTEYPFCANSTPPVGYQFLDHPARVKRLTVSANLTGYGVGESLATELHINNFTSGSFMDVTWTNQNGDLHGTDETTATDFIPGTDDLLCRIINATAGNTALYITIIVDGEYLI